MFIFAVCNKYSGARTRPQNNAALHNFGLRNCVCSRRCVPLVVREKGFGPFVFVADFPVGFSLFYAAFRGVARPALALLLLFGVIKSELFEINWGLFS
jgi:hypothetical protein